MCLDNPPTLPAIITAYGEAAVSKAAAEKAAFLRVVEKAANQTFTAEEATDKNADSSTVNFVWKTYIASFLTLVLVISCH